MIEPYRIDGRLGRLNTLVQEVNEREEPDAMIVLAHETPLKVAPGLDPQQVDLICGGHSHEIVAETSKNGIPCIQGNYNGNGFASAVLVFDGNGGVTVEDLKYTSVTDDWSAFYDTAENAARLDPEMMEISHAGWDAIREEMSEVLGYIDTPVIREDHIGADSAGNWITGLYLRATKELGTVAAFYNEGGIRTNFTIPRGKKTRDITVYDVYTINPFSNSLLVYEINGSELARQLADGLKWSNYGDQMSGLTFTYTATGDDTMDRADREYTILSVTLDDGTQVDLNDTETLYRVCTSTYSATQVKSVFSGKEPVVPEAEAPVDNEAIIRQLREEGLANGGRIPVDTGPRGTEVKPAAAETAKLTVSLPETVRGYTPCEIVITSPVAGEAELKLFDETQNLWLIRKEQIAAGENRIPWDGLGEFGERLFACAYRFLVKVKTTEGTELSAESRFNISGTTQTLVYALPSSDVLYLDKNEKWFVECFVSAQCLVRMEVEDAEGNVVYARDEEIRDPDGVCLNWSGAVNLREKIPAGEYTVRMWGKLNPSYVCSFPLTVKDSGSPKPAVAATGPILPERGMSEEEVWAVMMQPSVVINANGTSRNFKLYSAPNLGSRSAGTLHCALQGLEVLDTDGTWAHIRAWRHEDGQPVEGYYPLKQLTVSAPSPHYGVLIDKREQTLTLYQEGHAVGTVPVSTGLASPGNKYRETPAGAYLIDVHNGSSFAQDGYRYEYPLIYDGRYFIHGVGYTRSGRIRDYSNNQKLLGQKASHGCVRVSVMLQEGCNFNMYWLWSHLPYHTRVIILDD